MLNCDYCGRAVPRLFSATVYDDQEGERYSYSQVLDEQQLEQWFPGRNVDMSLCDDCYLRLTGRPPEPAWIEPAPRPQPSFTMRTLQSSIATVLARALFEECGYEVRHSGYEYQTPEWVSGLKSGDPNPAAARMRAMPDLRVYDRALNTLYEVEVKTTMQQPPIWRYRKDLLDIMNHYHPETILMVYVQREHKFSGRSIRDISWNSLPIYTGWEHPCYEIDLDSTFVTPVGLFTNLEPDAYRAFLESTGRILQGFASGPQD